MVSYKKSFYVNMSPRLKISEHVIQRLSNIPKDAICGYVYGLMYGDGSLLVVGLSYKRDEDAQAHNQLLLNLPTEVELCGVVKFGGALETEGKMKEILQSVDITDNPLALLVNASGEMKAHYLVHERFEEASYEVLSKEELSRQFLHLRLHTVIPFTCEATLSGVQTMLQEKRKKMASGQISFHIDRSTVYLFGVAADVGITGTVPEATIGEIVDSLNPEQHNKKKKYSCHSVEIVPVNILMKSTKDMSSDKVVKTAVKMVTKQGKGAYYIRMPLCVDGLVMAHRGRRLQELYSVLVEGACRSLRLLEAELLLQLGQEGIGDGGGLRLPETYHFLPDELGHFFTRILPKGISDDVLVEDRQRLHSQLGLPSRPIFRRGNAYPMKHEGPLVNVHEALGSQSRTACVLATVRGRYTYHHYMQDKIDDNGWGCAYRSLQTLCSWLRYQGYTTHPIPSHRDIQKCLVDIGDKPASFLGSRQWIGSTEVSFCLESLLGVTSRIIFANSGQELQSYAPDLINHFERHGSPIMIGGGVLAHTILGVEYNPSTLETRYLILDPHYTGPEDLPTIIGKGWCGWKTSDFWNKTAHYNLCLPQTTSCV